MKVVILVASVLVLASASGSLQAQTGHNCNPALTTFTVSSFLVTPWPLSKNVNAVMNMTGTFQSAQTLKSLNLYAKVNGVIPFQDSAPEKGTYAAGQTASIIYKAYVPSISPAGSYVVQLRLANSASVELNCWEVDFNL